VRLLYSATDGEAAGRTISRDELNELYRHRWPSTGKVWLRSNFVTSLDGSIAGPDGRAGSINTPSDHLVFALHRAHADAILVGAQTVRSEGYRAVDLVDWQRALRDEVGLAPFPVLAIVSRSLDLDPGIVANEDVPVGPVLIFTTTDHTSTDLAPFLAAGIEVLQLGQGDVDLTAATEQLAHRGWPRVLCEGGPRLHRDLLAADLVDEMSLTLAPVVVGGLGGRSTAGQALERPADFHLHLALHSNDESVFLNYSR
jgi:riboflavin biosynthesis pyrimidine reductase